MSYLKYIIDAAMPTWTRKIRERRALGFDPSTFVAVAWDGGGGVHAEVTEDLVGARLLLDALGPGLAASILDSPGCPPTPLGAVVLRQSGRVVAWSRHPLDFGLGSPS